jgi:hypothetical protein
MAAPKSAGANGNGRSPDDDLRELLASIPISRIREAGLLEPLVELTRPDNGDAHAGNGHAPDGDAAAASIDDLDADALIRLTLGD